MIDRTNGRPDLSKQEMNMNTSAYENETLELTVDELDAVSGGWIAPLQLIADLNKAAPPTVDTRPGGVCGPNGGGFTN
jgi:hypothetical protein